MTCSSREREAEVSSFLQDFVGNGSATGALVIATYECAEHGPHVEHFICTKPVPNAKDHVRAAIDRMRAYADALENHYFGSQPIQPITRSHRGN